MKKEEYMNILKAEPNEISLTKKDIVEWLDALVDTRLKTEEATYDLCWGKFNDTDGAYSKEICPCSFEATIHIFNGIQLLAKAVNCELQVENRDDPEYEYEYWFRYKGVRIFQLEKLCRFSARRDSNGLEERNGKNGNI